MFRKLLAFLFLLGLVGSFAACAEKDVKVTTKTESQTESEPTDVSPGEDVVR